MYIPLLLNQKNINQAGTLNMSRIDTATLDLEYETGVTSSAHSVSVYACKL